MLKFSLLVFVFCIAACIAQDYDEYPEPRSSNAANRYSQYEQEAKAATTTAAPVAILKQINRHNDDGSYTFGYEAADGSFKIETKSATGEVKGKYGYFDGERVRVVEYGANKHGFQPSGEGITVPPPTFHDDREEEEQEYEAPRPQYAVKPKYSKQQSPAQARPQALNYEPIFEQNPQPRKPAISAQQYQQPQSDQYDYEDEIATTKRPVQLQSRPKYAAPVFQFTSSPAPPPSHSPFANSIDIIYADPRQVQAANVKSQYLGDRRPPQFPQQEPPAPTPIARADEFSLFSPADSRGDNIYKPKSTPTHFAQQSQPPRDSYQFVSQPAPSQPQRAVFASKPLQQRTTSILDQLAKDYALPQSSAAALHDISFGYNV